MGKFLLIILIIIVAIIIWLISTYNGLVRSRNTVDEANSTMDVYLKKRFDLIPNLVEAVKGYATHEKETLQAVIAALMKQPKKPAQNNLNIFVIITLNS